MPGIDAADAMLALPVWGAGALLLLLIAACVLALRRSGSSGSVAALFGIPALVIIAWAAWTYTDQSILSQRAAQRQALDARAAQLTASAMMPGSALTCLDAVAGEAVQTSCERAIFASPEAVAAAAAYVDARLRLLADGLDYARRSDNGYQIVLAGLRRAVEADRFGFVAQVLAARDGCTPDQCAAFALLRDPSAVQANLRAHTYETNVNRYEAAWSAPAPVAAVAPATPAAPAAATSKTINFPGASSIPPVSIMNSEPRRDAAAGSDPAAPRAPASTIAPRAP